MWNTLTIKKYLELHTINRMVSDPVEKNIRLLACYKGVTQKEIEALTVRDLGKELKKIEFLQVLPTSTKLHHNFRCNGSVYKAALLTEGMTGGQFIDFNTIGKDEKPENKIYHIHELLAVMCLKRRYSMKPPFIRYEYEGWEKTAQVFNDHLTMDIAYPYYVFFCKVMENLQQPILDYSIKKVRKEMRGIKKIIKRSKSKTTSTSTGDGR